MREPSRTARVVAAHRLAAEREYVPYGDPDADDALAADVASGIDVDPASRIARYLRGRTRAFDRAITRAIARGNRQVVSLGAGYDGRALRFAREGVRWFEVDHPLTQADKLERLERLGIDASAVTFVGSDFETDDVDSTLISAGFAPDVASLFFCEGVLAYLTPQMATRLLSDVRSLATPGTRLVVSLRPRTGSSPEGVFSLADRVARVGEPLRLGDIDHDALLAGARWRPVETSAGAARVGLVVGTPVWRPGRPTTRSVVGAFRDTMLHRAGIGTLGAHLERTYGVRVESVRQLDLGTMRVDLAGDERWIARLLPPGTPATVASAQVDCLRFLADSGFPAERIAMPEAVSVHEGEPVIVTEFVHGTGVQPSQAVATALGDLLGQMQTLPSPPCHPGGAWHHLAPTGGPAAELDALARLLDARPSLPDCMRAQVAALDRCEGLPAAFSHADLNVRNVICGPDRLVVVDWAGCGIAPRIWPLAYLLWALFDPALVDTALHAYSAHVTLTSEEWDRLPHVIPVRATVLDLWPFALGRPADEYEQRAHARDTHVSQVVDAVTRARPR